MSKKLKTKIEFTQMLLPALAAYRSTNSYAYQIWLQLRAQPDLRQTFKADPKNQDIEYTVGQFAETFEAARSLQQNIFREAKRLGWLSMRFAQKQQKQDSVLYYTNLIPSGDGYVVCVTLP